MKKTTSKVRRSIFEILEDQYDFNKEFQKITRLYHSNIIHDFGYGYQMEMFVNQAFHQWKSRGSCINCADMRKELGVDNIITKTEYTQNDIILCLEYYLNILSVFVIKCLPLPNGYAVNNDLSILQNNIDLLVEHLNLTKQVIADEEKILLIPNNPAAIAVAETAPKDIAFAIIRYNHASLKGQLESKRRLLLSIANEYEHLLQKPVDGFSDYFKITNGLLNNLNIRHNNKEGKNQKEIIKNMLPQDLEKHYDDLYQLLLFCVLAKDNSKRKKVANELLKKIKETTVNHKANIQLH